MLTLDPSTLFYWTLYSDSNKKQKCDDGDRIVNWAIKIPRNARPASRLASHGAPSSRSGPATTGRKSSSSRPTSVVPSLTAGSTAPSVLTENIKITSHVAEGPSTVKAEPADPAGPSDDEDKVCSFSFFHRYINDNNCVYQYRHWSLDHSAESQHREIFDKKDFQTGSIPNGSAASSLHHIWPMLVN
jgi:hypothetical protein